MTGDWGATHKLKPRLFNKSFSTPTSLTVCQSLLSIIAKYIPPRHCTLLRNGVWFLAITYISFLQNSVLDTSSPDFSREHHNGCTFLNFCSLYICLALEQFCNEQEKILWALIFFKGSHATKWSKNVFRQETDTGIFPIQTWGDFEQQFQVHFFPMNTEADTINTLEGTSYHQGDQTVDDYLDSFWTLVSDAGYTDPRTLVVKFQQGLKLGIQNQIATIPYERPADTDPDAWYRAAQRIDQVHLANEAFQSVLHSIPSTLLKTVSARPLPLFIVRLPPTLPLLVTPKPPPPTLSVGIPMDVDADGDQRV